MLGQEGYVEIHVMHRKRRITPGLPNEKLMA
jgi:hypothetical protein